MAELNLENEHIRVDVELQPTLTLLVTDKRNGFSWECPGAPFSFHYWQASQFAVRTTPLAADRGWEFRPVHDKSGQTIQCSWPRGACGFRVNFRLEGPALDLTLAARRFVENRPFDARLMAIDILPGFGGAKTGENGFLMIPRGNGTLCRFDKPSQRATSLLAYAGGDRALTAPVFGIAHDSAGLLGITARGQYNTELVVRTGDGPGNDRTWAGPRARLRFAPGDPLEYTDFLFRYCFLDRDQTNLAGMAKAYRSYLIESEGRSTLRARIGQNPLLEYAASSPVIHVHMAEKRKKSRMTGDGELVVRTQFGQVPRIARAIQKAGLEQASLVLVGWNCEGNNGLYPARFPVERAVGGADAMNEALNSVRQLDFQVGALDNYTDLYRRSPASRDEFTAKQPGGRPWRNGVWAGGQAYVVCPHQARERHAQRDMRRLHDLGLDGVLHLDHMPGPGVLRCDDPQHPLTRSQYAQEMVAIVHMARDTFGLCRVSGASVFLALEADSCIVPVEEPAVVDDLDPAWFADESVPFLSLALHGITLIAADADADPLRVAEFGAVPFFHLSAEDQARVIPKLVDFGRRYVSDLAPLAEQFIESYETPAEGLRAVGYSGGQTVLVNRTDQPVELNGVTIPAESFQVD